jgi:hypothetical protein
MKIEEFDKINIGLIQMILQEASKTTTKEELIERLTTAEERIRMIVSNINFSLKRK